MHSIPNREKIITHIIQDYEMELKRISSELHEGIAQNLYSLYTNLQFAEKRLKPETVSSSTAEMIKSMKQTIEELRWLSVEIYPSSLESHGFLAALKSYLKVFASTFGIIIDFQSNGQEIRLPNLTETIVFRVCQELLKSVARHADTEKVRIIIKWEDSCLSVLIEDFGIGFDMNEKKEKGQIFGMAALEEKIKLVEGTFRIASRFDNGTIVEIFVPIVR